MNCFERLDFEWLETLDLTDPRDLLRLDFLLIGIDSFRASWTFSPEYSGSDSIDLAFKFYLAEESGSCSIFLALLNELCML